MADPVFPPTRTAALEALSAFVPKAGSAYTSQRNFDRPGHGDVSCLSPYIRHRIITEQEVLEAVLARFAPSTAEKFVQEVFWRTFWKGWLEQRPSVWASYQTGCAQALNRIATESGLRAEWEAACSGETGIAPFDHWARELVETGYMHNHARMWFASIWIFTLRLPWELGADFFLRHLLDGDPASNTLGWRWVAGLQTRGKTYLARPENIARYTEGRFNAVEGLATFAPPLDGPEHPPRSPLPTSDPWQPGPGQGLLVSEEDLSFGWLFQLGLKPQATAALLSHAGRSTLRISPGVERFTKEATEHAMARYTVRLGSIGPVTSEPETIAQWAKRQGLTELITPYAPTGPAAAALASLEKMLAQEGISLRQPIRPYDQAAWPHATAGFFKFKEKIPRLLGALKGVKTA